MRYPLPCPHHPLCSLSPALSPPPTRAHTHAHARTHTRAHTVTQGQTSCTVSANPYVFGEPGPACPGTRHTLAVTASCTPNEAYTVDGYFKEWSEQRWEAAASMIGFEEQLVREQLSSIAGLEYPHVEHTGRSSPRIAPSSAHSLVPYGCMSSRVTHARWPIWTCLPPPSTLFSVSRPL
jgi:hypothetical protein